MFKEKIHFRLDGDLISEELISQFSLRENSRNVRYSSKLKGDVLNFVGFIIKEDSMLVSLPKHYIEKSLLHSLNERDISLLFNVLLKNQLDKDQSYLGEKENFNSNYPFLSFFNIYKYYQKYGLYQEVYDAVKPGCSGKISWKNTVTKSETIINGKSIIFMPFYIKKSYSKNVFISECMIYAINYTIQRFYTLIKLRPIDGHNIKMDFFKNKEYIVSTLHSILSHVFKDQEKRLVRSLIDFFNGINDGGNIIVKHYNFELIWEEMVGAYLNKYFLKMKNDLPEFDTSIIRFIKKFNKKSFHINKENPYQYIEIDHYWMDQAGNQYVFDSKYYSSLDGLDYKQMTYIYTLRKLAQNQTFAVLLLPTEKDNYSELYFELNEKYYTNEEQKVKIIATYLNARRVLKEYVI